MEHEGQESFGTQTGSTTSKAIETLQREASELGREAKRASSEILEQRVDKVFSFLDDLENAVRAAASELKDENHPRLAQYVNRAADEVAQARDRFGSTDLNGMVAAAENLARTRPVVVLAMAFAAGFAFVRFLKSSTPEISRRSSGGEGEYAAFDTYSSQSRGYPGQSSRQSYGGEFGGGGSYGAERQTGGREFGGSQSYGGQGSRGSQFSGYGPDAGQGQDERYGSERAVGGTQGAGQQDYERHQGGRSGSEQSSQRGYGQERKDDSAKGRDAK